MKRPLPVSILLATLSKACAIGIFFLFFSAFPINKQYSLYNRPEFIGRPSTSHPPHIVTWANFDGYNYLLIAREGYGPERVPFFPLYPIVTHVTHELLGQRLSYVVTGQFISFLSFIGALTMLFCLLKADKMRALTVLIVMSILLFPTSYSYTAVYNDSLFFFLTMSTLYFGRKQKWPLASLCAALATLARLNGLALFPYLIFEYVTTSSRTTSATWHADTIKAAITRLSTHAKMALPLLWTLLIPLAFIGYLWYIHATFGDWHILFTSMKPWGQDKIISPIQTLFRYAKILMTVRPDSTTYLVAALEVGSFLWYSLMLWRSWGAIRLSYWVFFFCSILIPALTGTFQGMPRYGLHLYPLFLITAIWLSGQPRFVRMLYFLLSAILYCICITLFTHGIFIA